MNARTLRRLPQVSSLSGDTFEHEVYEPLAEAVQTGVCDKDAASQYLLEAIQPWMESYAKRGYHRQTRNGSSVGSDAQCTISEVQLTVYTAVTRHLDWTCPAGRARSYLTTTAGFAIKQAGREDDELDRRQRVYLRHARAAVDAHSAKLGRPLNSVEFRAEIARSLREDVPDSVRPSERFIPQCVEMIERLYPGVRVQLADQTSDDAPTNERWDGQIDNDHAEDVIAAVGGQPGIEAIREWISGLPDDVASEAMSWLDNADSGARPPARLITRLGTHRSSLVACWSQIDTERADAAQARSATKRTKAAR